MFTRSTQFSSYAPNIITKGILFSESEIRLSHLQMKYLGIPNDYPEL